MTLTQKGRLLVIQHRAKRLRERMSRPERPTSFAGLELLHHQIEGYRQAILARHGEDALRRADRLAELTAQAKDFDFRAERELVARAAGTREW